MRMGLGGQDFSMLEAVPLLSHLRPAIGVLGDLSPGSHRERLCL